MKQESIFHLTTLKDSDIRYSFRSVSSILLAVLMTAILAISIYMIVSARISDTTVELAVLPQRLFLAVNPETRYVEQAVASNFLAVNPETKFVRPYPDVLVKTLDRVFLAINPETRYAQYSSSRKTQIAETNFLKANPETHYAHIDSVLQDTSSEHDSLAINPEVRYVIYSVDIYQKGSDALIEANPELMLHLQHMDAKNLK